MTLRIMRMKLLLYTIIAVLGANLMAEDAFYVIQDENKFTAKIKDSHLVMKVKLKKVSLPKAVAIGAFATPESPQKYCVQVSLAERPKADWLPVLSVSGKIYFKGVGVTIPNDPRFGASFRLCSDDPQEVITLANSLAKLLKVPQSKVTIAVTVEKEKP